MRALQPAIQTCPAVGAGFKTIVFSNSALGSAELEMKAAVPEAFQHDGPALVEAVVNRTELATSPTIKLDQPIGFNLWALKAVLSGRGDEVIDLAVSNLTR